MASASVTPAAVQAAAQPDAVMRGQEESRDWTKVPVGVPFTETTTMSEQFDVTVVSEKDNLIRETWLNAVPYEQVGYVMEPYEVEVTETVMRNVEVEVVETVLEEFEVEVEVRCSAGNGRSEGLQGCGELQKCCACATCLNASPDPHPRPRRCPSCPPAARSGP